MVGEHYIVLLSWVLEVGYGLTQLMEQLGAQPETSFLAKQILDLFLAEVPDLEATKYQLAAAAALRIAFLVGDL